MIKERKKIKKPYTAREYAFVWAILAIPIIHFIVLYVLVKADSLVLAFQKYEDGEYVWNGFNNFKKVFTDYFASESGFMFTITKNSFLIFLANMAWFPVPVFAAYIIWKKVPFSGVYKVIMYLPSILPSMVTALAFKYLVGLGFPEIFGNAELANLLTNEETTNRTLYWYTRWIGLGGSLVIYLGAMAAVDQSVIEYGQLDGLSLLGEFWHIVLPKIWPTMIALIISHFGTMLTADLGWFSFFGETKESSKYSTLGYYITVKTKKGPGQYPYLSTLGILTSLFTIPIVYAVKAGLEKVGPSEE